MSIHTSGCGVERKGFSALGRRLSAVVSARYGVRFLAATCAMALVWLPARAAVAEFELGADLDAVYSLEGDRSAGGAGFGLRVGQRVSLPLLMMAVELKGGFDSYGGDRRSKVYTGLAGGRLGVGTVVRASLLAHVGVGRVTHEFFPADPAADRTGFAADVGAALDLTLLPLVDVGVHAGYGVITNAEFDWLRAGLHATLVF